MKLIDIQTALAALGFRPGPLDGIWGRQTAAALREFQASEGLDPDGIVGPMTLAALFPDDSVMGKQTLSSASLVWFKEAQRLIGTKETLGTGSNPDILDWATDIGIPYKGDDIAWCGLFVGHCITSTLDREPTPPKLLSARAWERFGIKTAPTPGAVMVFWREAKESWKGHVGFYAGEDKSAYRILGGNQADSVSLAWVSKDRLVDARRPSTVPPPVAVSVKVARTDSLSWDEA